MDFNKAVQAHSGWKLKLNNYLNNPDNSINIHDLSCDNLCELGKWLHSSETVKYRALPEFIELVKEHAAFHKAAAEIVTRKNKGEDVKSDIVLSSDSPFAQHSSNVVRLIMFMRNKI